MTRTTETLQHTAARWFAQIQDSAVTVDEMLAWQRWMRADARHAEAFRRIEETWDVMQDASPGRIEAMSAPAPRGFSAAGMALAASLVVAAVATGWFLFDMNSRDVLRTEVGRHQTQQLTDGSEVVLGGDSRVEVQYSDSARRLALLQGEALFTVARDPERPFEVRVGETKVTAIGTAFNIRRSGERVVVSVVEGRVLVESSNTGPQRLDAGQQTTVDRQGAHQVRLDDPASPTAWREGLITFEREPLKYVLQDVNRYAATPIVADDIGIGEIRVTGTVMSGKVDEWIVSLEGAFDLRATREQDRIVLTRRR